MRKLFFMFFAFFILAQFLALHSIQAQNTFIYTYHSDFPQYPPGSDGSPEWLTHTTGWEIQKDAFLATDVQKSYAVLNPALYGKLHSMEVIVNVGKANGDSWKIAGVMVYQNDENYWHFALGEAPDNMGKGHFVELVEMYRSNWLSQSQKPTALTMIESRGGDFRWQYNHPYRLKLHMSPEQITGILEELNGQVRAKISYRLDKQTAVTFGKPGLDNGGFQTDFRQFSAQVGQEVKYEPEKPEIPAYESHGSPVVKGKATGYFHTEKIKDTWWVMDPAGNSFYITGTDHVNYNAHWCESLGYAPYHRNCEKLYGTEAKWAEKSIARLASWGFNSLGVGCSPSTRYRGLPYMTMVNFGTNFSSIDYITPKTTWTGFPNVFSPRFPIYCDKIARQFCEPFKNDPWLIGYFLDNELEWFPNTSSGIFADTFKLPADHSAKQALVEFFKQRYPDIAGFNRAWNLNIKQFDDLLTIRRMPGSTTEDTRADQQAFIRLVAEKYFAITTAAIKKADPHHLILGCRFAGDAPDIWDITGKYCDIVSVNCYRNLDLTRGVMVDGFEADLARWYQKAGRPLMITEWSFPALDAGLPCKHGAGQRVPTQKDRAFAFTAFQRLLFSTPFIVGSNYFMWADEPELGISSTFPEDSNYGLVDVKDDPYPLLTGDAAKLNPLAYDFHRHDSPDVSVTLSPDNKMILAGNTGGKEVSGTISIWLDGRFYQQPVKLPGDTQKAVETVPVWKPGGHLLHAEIIPGEPIYEVNSADNTVTKLFYAPGLPFDNGGGLGKVVRVPLVVANPTPDTLLNVPFSLGLQSIFSETTVPESIQVRQYIGGNEQTLPAQVIGTGTNREIMFMLDRLEAYQSKTIFVYTGSASLKASKSSGIVWKRTTDGFTLDNGVLKVVKNDMMNGNAFDRMELSGKELGWFLPLVWEQTRENRWVRPERVEDIQVYEGEVGIVLDMTFSFGGNVQSNSGKNDSNTTQNRPHGFRTRYRFVFYPGQPFFESRMLWIENSDSEPWRIGAYYHYLISNIAGNAADDKPEINCWVDSKAGIRLGVADFSGSYLINFWKEDNGQEHPDTWRKLDLILQPGERYTETLPPVYIVAGKQSGDGSWGQVVSHIRQKHDLIWQLFAVEKKE
jgi:hypothetical protein